ncbi:MAG: LacI family DNA-binding transcriptional regulator [Verrucomicrobia bacterium]|nr:LacI family DNA-binding transcriptional regulator [Verrucomicrobiota bacterium]
MKPTFASPGPLNRPAEALEPGRKAVTLSDVARHLGVGTMTVSRALNKPEKVSLPLRTKILKAVDELGYVQNRVASGLASGTSRIIPVAIPTLLHSVYIPMLEGVYSVLARHGYQIILGTTEYLITAEEQLVKAFLGSSPAGLILSGVEHSAKTIKLLKRAHLPVVEVMDLTDRPLTMNIGFSHYEVGVAVARYFYQKGYQRISYAGTLTEIDFRSIKRIAGFQQTLKDYGLPHHFIQRINEPFSIGLGAKLLDGLLRQYPNVEAVFFANDDLAAGALFECRRRDIRVPDDLAIMGFNDQEIAGLTVPAITSVATPRREIGQAAAQMLVKQLQGQPSPDLQLDLGFKIVERQSTAADRVTSDQTGNERDFSKADSI